MKLTELIRQYPGLRSRSNCRELPGFVVWQTEEVPGSNYSNNRQSNIATF